MKNKVDYNSIAEVYNSRYSEIKLSNISKHIHSLTGSLTPANILEVGCGTCHWLSGIDNNTAMLCGIDLSLSMLNVAKSSTKNIFLINGSADQIPIKNNSFDLIFVVNAIHQFSSTDYFIKEAFNLLKKNGRLLVIGLEPRESHESWFLYKYFEGTYENDLIRYPTFETLGQSIRSANFTGIKTEFLQKIKTKVEGKEILNNHFIDKRSGSQLALLSDEEYKKGIEQIKRDIESAEKEKRIIEFCTELNFYSITGIKK